MMSAQVPTASALHMLFPVQTLHNMTDRDADVWVVQQLPLGMGNARRSQTPFSVPNQSRSNAIPVQESTLTQSSTECNCATPSGWAHFVRPI